MNATTMFRHALRASTLAVLTALGAPVMPAGAQMTRRASIDAAALLGDLRTLAHDSMEGRRTGTPGNERARRFLDGAFARAGLQPIGTSFRHSFTVTGREGGSAVDGINFVGRITGTDTTRAIIITAHYDHLGRRGDDVFNGADDNASGVAALLALARVFALERPQHSMVFVALDAEEGGLRGARAFVAQPPVPASTMALNVNMDMVSRNEKGELWVAGTHHYPLLRPFVERLADTAPVTLRTGHDVPGTGSNDWTSQSDHAAFHAAGIPFLYFGVEDHADYHRATDDIERIEPGFFVRSVETILAAVRGLDRELDALVARRTP